MAALCLLFLLLPLSRVAAQFLLPSGGATALARLHVSGLELLFIAAVFADRRVHVPALRAAPRWLGLATLTWLLLALAAVAQSAVPAVAAVRQAEWLVHILFGLSLWAFATAYPKTPPALLRWAVLGFLLYVIPLTLFLLLMPDKGSYPWINGILGFANVRHFGYYAAIVLVLAHDRFLRMDAPAAGRLGGFLLLVVVWAYLAWSGSRGPIFAVLGSLLVLSLFGLPRQKLRLWATTLAAGALGAAVSIPFTPPHGSFGILRFARTIKGAEGDIATYSAGRTDFWADGWEQLVAHPWFGLGPDQLLFAGDRGGFWSFVQPHNIFLQTGLEWGVVAALIFLVVLAVLAVRRMFVLGRDRSGQSGDKLVWLWLVLMLSALSLIDGTYYHAIPLMAVAAGFALVMPAAPRTAASNWDTKVVAGAAGAIILAGMVAFWAVLTPSVPRPGDIRVRIVQAFPAVMALTSGGSRMDRWATAWHADDPEVAHDLLDWIMQRSRIPWTSMAAKAQLLDAEGKGEDAVALMQAARQRAPAGWEFDGDEAADD